MNFSAIDTYLEKHSDFGVLILRIFIGGRLVYGVLDNVISWDQMLEFAHFLEIHLFPLPIISAVISVYVQLIGGLCLLLGFQVRIASLFLVLNFIVAMLFVHLASGDSIEAMTPALAMLFGSAALMFLGRGK